MNLRVLLSIILTSSCIFSSCRHTETNKESSDLDSISVKTIFPGKDLAEVRSFLQPIRLEILQSNEALCVLPFSQSYESWDKEMKLSLDERRELDSLVRKYGNKYLVQSSRKSQNLADKIIKDLAVATMSGSNAANLAATGAQKVKAFTMVARPIVLKALEDSELLKNFFIDLETKFGYRQAHGIITKIIPSFASLEKSMLKLLDLIGFHGEKAIQALDLASKISERVLKVAPFLGSSLRFLSDAASGISSSILACSVTNGMIAQLELWELEATFLDASVPLERKQVLTHRYCLAHRALNENQSPPALTCP